MNENLKDFYNNLIIEYFGKLNIFVMPERLLKIRRMINSNESELLIKSELIKNIPYLKFQKG